MGTRGKTIASLMAVIFAVCAVFLALIVTNGRKSIEETVREKEKGAAVLAAYILKDIQTQYKSRINSFVSYKGNRNKTVMISAFAKRDRQTLLEISKDYLRLFQGENKYFSTIGWITPDNINFIRANKPDVYGDDISSFRQDIVAVNKLHKPVSGFMIGKTGMEYRVVHPVYFQGEYLGAVQFGIKGQLFLDMVTEQLGIAAALIIPLEFCQLVDDKEGLPEINCGDFVIRTRERDVFAAVGEDFNFNKDRHWLEVGNRTFSFYPTMQFTDFRGKDVSQILLAVDITTEKKRYDKFVVFSILLSLTLAVSSLLILYFSFGRMLAMIFSLNVSLEKSNSELEERVRARTSELEENVQRREENEQQQQQLNNEFETIFANSMAGIMLLRGGRVLARANQRLADIIGYDSPEDMVGISMRKIHLSEERFVDFGANYYNRLLSGRRVEVEYKLKHRDGSSIWCILAGKAVDSNHPPDLTKGVVWVVDDISKRKEMEKDVLRAKKLESIGVLARGIGHDFNNILTAVIGNISLGLAMTEADTPINELLQSSKKASLKARDLTGKLLTFAQQGETVRQAASLPELIVEAADLVLSGSKVKAKFEFADKLWLVDINPGQIAEVIRNLIMNGRQAMPDGGIIDITCRNFDNEIEKERDLGNRRYVKISCTDRGIGIASDKVEQIFDPYFSTRERDSNRGSGLGLAIVHSVIDKHGGHVRVSSIPNKGTTFTLFLPAAYKKNVATTASDVIRPETGKGSVLVMDDDEMVLSVAEQMLGFLGYDVIVTSNGEEAVAEYRRLLENNRFVDHIILDLTIPGGMGGKEAAGEILALDPTARIIVASGYSNDPVMLNFREYGFADSVEKPFSFEGLSRVVKNGNG